MVRNLWVRTERVGAQSNERNVVIHNLSACTKEAKVRITDLEKSNRRARDSK